MNAYHVSKLTFYILIILSCFSLYNFANIIKNFIFRRENLAWSTEEYVSKIKFFNILSYISWLSYLLFFIILIYINWTQTKKYTYKILFTVFFILCIYLPLFPVLNVLNIILYFLLNNTPFIEDIDTEFPGHNKIKNEYSNIKNEYNHYDKKIDCFRDNNPLLGKIDTVDNKNDHCWRTLYLKKTGKLVEENREYFPYTMEVLQDDQIHTAFFSILDSYVEIKPHYGYYKGYLRYHLGINIHEENGKKPYIVCGGEKREWKEGGEMMFDDMYMHYVNNPTNKKRVILYLDIERKNIDSFSKMITYLGNNLIENSAILNLFIKNQHIQDKI